MASGERNPLLKTDSPSRVTSRSSWISTKWCEARREIFRRTEFDPMSTAAKVGMRKQCSKHSAFGNQHSALSIQPKLHRWPFGTGEGALPLNRVPNDIRQVGLAQCRMMIA